MITENCPTCHGLGMVNTSADLRHGADCFECNGTGRLCVKCCEAENVCECSEDEEDQDQ